jgi:hypothetical protein
LGWIPTLFVGMLVGIAGLLGTGLLASVFADWFRITGREGAAGYKPVRLVGATGVLPATDASPFSEPTP